MYYEHIPYEFPPWIFRFINRFLLSVNIRSVNRGGTAVITRKSTLMSLKICPRRRAVAVTFRCPSVSVPTHIKLSAKFWAAAETSAASRTTGYGRVYGRVPPSPSPPPSSYLSPSPPPHTSPPPPPTGSHRPRRSIVERFLRGRTRVVLDTYQNGERRTMRQRECAYKFPHKL